MICAIYVWFVFCITAKNPRDTQRPAIANAARLLCFPGAEIE